MSQAFFDGYTGMELTLPNGHQVKAKVLTLEQAAHFLRLYAKRTDDPEAVFTIMQEFPTAVALPELATEVTVVEFWEVFDSFFDRRQRPGEPPRPTPTPAPPPGTNS